MYQVKLNKAIDYQLAKEIVANWAKDSDEQDEIITSLEILNDFFSMYEKVYHYDSPSDPIWSWIPEEDGDPGWTIDEIIIGRRWDLLYDMLNFPEKDFRAAVELVNDEEEREMEQEAGK